MASGLKKWFAEKWVDIGSKKKGGGVGKTVKISKRISKKVAKHRK